MAWVAALSIVACSSETLDSAAAPANVRNLDCATADARSRVLAVRTESDPVSRTSSLARALECLGSDDSTVLASVVRDPYSFLGPTEMLLLVDRWASLDPEAATQWAAAGADVSYRGAATQLAARQWALVDPTAVVDRYGVANDDVSKGLIPGWFASGQPGLEEFVLGLGAGEEGQRAISLYLRESVRSRPAPELMRWAESVDTSRPVKLAIYRQLGSELAMVDPEAAVAWCDRHCAGPYGRAIRTLVAKRWVETDPHAVMDWIAEMDLSDGEERAREARQAARAAFRAWIRKDKQAALEWSRSIPEPELEAAWAEPIITMHIAVVSWNDPGEALAWAERVRDPGERELSYITIARRWRSIDPQAAEGWLETSPLNEEARAKALEYPEGYRGARVDEKTVAADSGTDDPLQDEVR
ncbi:MAG: hypothetical protein CL908_26125 [Deltaproteobacteria bacterium]|nr:hypothetical protein [Deltaproteobacteria bacterium]